MNEEFGVKGATMKWLVVWIVIQTFNVPCEHPDPPPDKFGREALGFNTTAVACFEEEKTEHHKFFETIEKAKAFIKDGEKELIKPNDVFNNGLKDFRLYELKDPVYNNLPD